MKSILIFVSFLSIASSQFMFDMFKLENLIANLEQSEVLASNDCLGQLKLLSAVARDEKPTWAGKMIDSWSKLPDKIKYGNTFDFGDFDQCLQIHEKINQVELVGQHCLFQFYSRSNDTIFKNMCKSEMNQGWKSLNERFSGAICLPAACKPEEVKIILHLLLNESDYKVADDYEQTDYCKTSQTSSKSATAALFVTGFLLLFVISSTVYDSMTRKVEKTKQNELFMAFSLHRNLSNLLQTNNESTNEVKCLSFIRSSVTICTFLGHILIFVAWFPSDFPVDLITPSINRILGIAALSINAFFVISGLLATRNVVKLIKIGNFKLLQFYFQRYMRVTPTVAFVLLITYPAINFVIQNYPYAFHNDLLRPCDKFWWSTLLHVQNQVNPKEICLPWTWYLAVDWQMYVLTPVLIYTALKFGKKLLVALLSTLFILSSWIGYKVSLENNFMVHKMTIFVTFNDSLLQALYLPTHIHGSVFIIGMILGVYFDELRDWLRKSSSRRNMVSTAVLTPMMAYTAQFFILNDDSSPELQAIFASSVHNVSGISFAWLILVFECGTFERIDKFVTHNMWKPLGKLTFCFYMVHPAILYFQIIYRMKPIVLSVPLIITSFFSLFLTSIVLAVAVHLVVEEPFNRLSKLASKHIIY